MIYSTDLRIVLACGELYKKVGVVGLHLCLVGGLVADNLAALFTLVDYDISAAWVGKCLYRTENSAAGVHSVTGIYVYVKRTKAEGTVIARGVSKRKYLLATAFADKSVIVF